MHARTLAALFSLSIPVSTALAQSTWYVDVTGNPPGSGTQSDPYTSLQYAIEQTTTLDGDTLLVAAGTYFELIDFSGKSLVVDGSGALERPTLDGLGEGTVVQIVSGEGSGTTLRGFRITGGVGEGGGPKEYGGGIRVRGKSTALLADLWITRNRAVYGGGLSVRAGSTVTLLDSLIRDNIAEVQGGGARGASTLRVSACLFEGNRVEDGSGGGAFGGRYEDCVFRGNRAQWGAGVTGAEVFESRLEENHATWTGGAAMNTLLVDSELLANRAEREGGGAAYCTLRRCKVAYNRVETTFHPRGGGLFNCDAEDTLVYGNVAATSGSFAGWGGGAYGTSRGSYTRCIFVGNRADYGAGVDFYVNVDLTPLLDRCTIVGNVARFGAGGLSLFGRSADVRDSILWGNRPDQISEYFSGSVAVRYSAVEGGFPGTGNLTLDPLLFGATGSDAHLLPGSPCIDAGDPFSPPDPDGSRADMGALPYDAAWLGAALPYCAPDPTPEGCLPLVRAEGTPSLSGPDDFELRAQALMPGRLGVLLLSRGPGGTPFGKNLICVSAPLWRRTPQVVAPAEACAGVLLEPLSQADLLGFGLLPGDRLYAQFWLRATDPAIVEATEAIEATILP